MSERVQIVDDGGRPMSGVGTGPLFPRRPLWFPRLGDLMHNTGPRRIDLWDIAQEYAADEDPSEERWPTAVHVHILADDLFEVLDGRIADWKIETRERYAR